MSSDLLPYLLFFAAGLAVGAAIVSFLQRRTPASRASPRRSEPKHKHGPASGEEESLMRIAALSRDLDEANSKLMAVDRVAQAMALSDPLTGIANRTLLTERIDHAITRGLRHNTRLAVLMVDLNEFHPLVERFGAQMCDTLLISVARKLRAAVRSEDTVARLDDDHFAIVLEGAFEREDVERAAESVMRAFAEPFTLGDEPVTITATVSSALFPGDGENAETLLRTAEQSLTVTRNRRRQSRKKAASPAP